MYFLKVVGKWNEQRHQSHKQKKVTFTHKKSLGLTWTNYLNEVFFVNYLVLVSIWIKRCKRGHSIKTAFLFLVIHFYNIHLVSRPIWPLLDTLQLVFYMFNAVLQFHALSNIFLAYCLL